MRNMTLSGQLLLLFGGVTAAVIVTTFLSGQGLFQLAAKVVATGEATESELGHIYAVLDGSSVMQSHVQIILGQKDPDIIEVALEELHRQEAEIRAALTACGAPCTQAQASFENVVKVNAKTIEIFLTGNIVDSYAALATDVAPSVNNLLDDIRNYSNASTKAIKARNEATGDAAKFRATWVLALSGTIAFLIIVAGTIFRRRLSSRLQSTVVSLEKIAEGNFDQRLPTAPRDELGSVGSAVNSMAEKIGSLLRSIEDKNRDLTSLNANLESLVAERTRAIRTILDNVNIGLFICDKQMNVREGYSAECKTLFARSESSLAGRSLSELLQLNPRAKDHFQSLYDQIFDDTFLLGDLSVGQLPNRLTVEGKDLQLIGCVVKDEQGNSDGVLFCLSDITSLVSAEKQNARNQSLIMMISNRDGFRDFVRDAENLFTSIRGCFKSPSKDLSLARGYLHTLKGNSGIYGLKDVSDAIHEAEGQESFDLSDIKAIENLFISFLEENRPILGIDYGKEMEDSYTVPMSMVSRVETASNASFELAALRSVIHEFFFRIRMKQAVTLMGPIEAAMKQLAFRLGKQVRFEFAGKTTLIPDALSPVFRSLPHLLRNAMDHGLEAPYERGSKPEEGVIKLSVESDEKTWVITIEDDGRGINAELLTAKAVEKKIIDPASAAKLSAAEKLALVFHSGLSTAEQATDISGRGVGMSAVKQTVDGLGGFLAIESVPQKGTRFIITIKHHSLPAAVQKVA